MRGHVAGTLIVAVALIVAMVIFCAGGYYYVEYQAWDAASSTWVYRNRPFSGAVLAVSVLVSAGVLFGAALLLLRTGRVHGRPVVDECPQLSGSVGRSDAVEPDAGSPSLSSGGR
ncbi:hypothetical protein AB0870_16230 [Microbacterium proteolyticum]|uniref:hypothetical protein n=1 Tax=Microbacterium proteolyticum TaxID=1572644 RepID=UPI0024178DCB|nr:hypothetical protein [Microbacterium proteolyticum]